MKNMGVDSYRFSISWSRILPSKPFYFPLILFYMDIANNVDQIIWNNIKCYIISDTIYLVIFFIEGEGRVYHTVLYVYAMTKHITMFLHAEGTIEGGINQEGIKYYNDLINELLKNGEKKMSNNHSI